MAGLAIIKHAFNLPEEALCERWVEIPIIKFCGEAFFRHDVSLRSDARKVSMVGFSGGVMAYRSNLERCSFGCAGNPEANLARTIAQIIGTIAARSFSASAFALLASRRNLAALGASLDRGCLASART
jgi:hypothetical protein